MTTVFHSAARRLAALAIVLLAVIVAIPATAVTVTIKNCSGSTQRIELRPGLAGPNDAEPAWVVDIYHTRDWSGSCGLTATCWVKVRPGQANEVNTQSAGEICLLQAQSSRPVTTVLGDCGCI